VVVIKSGRDNTEYLARARLTSKHLDWRLLEHLNSSGDISGPLIWTKARLKRTSSAEDERTLEDCKSFYANAL
jgi:hypothetical protein